jgi:hypothetical protein
MAKKLLGKIVTLTALGIVATTAISYILKYKSFHKDLEDDFFEFEDDDTQNTTTKDRNYIALSSDKDDFVMAAKDTFEASKGMAGAAKEILKDVGNIIVDNTSAAARVAGDMGKRFTQKNNFAQEDMAEAATDVKEDLQKKAEDIKDNLAETAKDLKEDVKDSFTDVKEDAKDFSADVEEGVKDFSSDVKKDVKDFSADVKEGAKDFAYHTSDTTKDIKEEVADTVEDIKESFQDSDDQIFEDFH